MVKKKYAELKIISRNWPFSSQIAYMTTKNSLWLDISSSKNLDDFLYMLFACARASFNHLGYPDLDNKMSRLNLKCLVKRSDMLTYKFPSLLPLLEQGIVTYQFKMAVKFSIRMLTKLTRVTQETKGLWI